MMSFIHSTRIYRILSGQMDCGWLAIMCQHKCFLNNVLTFLDNDTEYFLEITATDIFDGYPKLKSAFRFWSECMV